MLRRCSVASIGVVWLTIVTFQSSPTFTQVAAQYGVEDLGTLGQTGSYAEDIDWLGRVVGTTTGIRERAFYFDGTRSVHLDQVGGTLGGSRSLALGIGQGGRITGWSNPVGSTASRAYVYDFVQTREVGTLGGAHSFGFDVNSRGWVAGVSSLLNGDEHAFLFDGTTMRDLGTFGGRHSYAYALNDQGWVTGTAFTPNFAAQRAFRFDGTKMHDLGTLGGVNAIGRDINYDGWVVGGASVRDVEWRAFVHDTVSMRDLGTLGGSYSEAFGMNEVGDIVGESRTASGVMHAFLYSSGQMVDLNTLIDPASGWVLTAARAINDSGQIAGFGTKSGQSRAFRLTPAQDLGIWPFGAATNADSNRPNPVEVGRVVTFVMSVDALDGGRPSARQMVTVTDTIVGSVEIVQAYVPDGPACSIASKVVTCQVPEVGHGNIAREVYVSVRPTAPGAFGHTARVTGPAPDPNPANNEISEDNMAVSLAGVTVTPSTLPGGKASALRVNLTSQAPGGGATVALVSSNPAVAPVPTSIYVLGGGTTRALNVIPRVVTSPTTVTITATYGRQSHSSTLTVIPPVLSALYLSPTTVIGGCGTSAGKVALTGSAGSSGAVVTLSNTNAAATVPASAMVPAGAMSKTFTVTTQPLTALRSGTVTASYGGVFRALTLRVRPIRVRTLVLTPNPVVGGSSVTGTITLECGAAPGNLVVTLSSSNTALAVPTVASITIPAGAMRGAFSVRTADVSGATYAYIYATVSGVRKSTKLSIQP